MKLQLLALLVAVTTAVLADDVEVEDPGTAVPVAQDPAAPVAPPKEDPPAKKRCPGDLEHSLYTRVDGDDCYVFSLIEKKEYDDAIRSCFRLGGTLAMPKTKSKNDFLTATLLSIYKYTENVWIGLDDREEEEKFLWADRTPLSATGWTYWAKENGPRESFVHEDFEDCVALEPLDRGQWHDYHCENALFVMNREFAYICQLKAIDNVQD